MAANFQAECARLQKTVVLEKCRHMLLVSDPKDPNWRWAADYVSKYGEAPTPATLNSNVNLRDDRPVEALSLTERVRAVQALIAQQAKN